MGVDFRTLTPVKKTLHGVYSDDFITFAELKDAAQIDDESLTRLVTEPAGGNVLEKTTFRFNNNRLTVEKDVSSERDQEIFCDSIPESQLTGEIEQTWSETLFYGIGNAKV
jgi:hypothetical protein